MSHEVDSVPPTLASHADHGTNDGNDVRIGLPAPGTPSKKRYRRDEDELGSIVGSGLDGFRTGLHGSPIGGKARAPDSSTQSSEDRAMKALFTAHDTLRQPQITAKSPALTALGDSVTTALSNAHNTRRLPGFTKKTPAGMALPTVRDHTTDQLVPEGDEYIPRESDENGEGKMSKDGFPLGGREYKCRTFRMLNRGGKLFMLATECAHVLGYRDSYLLFNKNRTLYKIIASQDEKDYLIHQEILPYSYRSRQIAIVTARSMFRQFGSRLIEGGRRVKDDYWEAKAMEQGFTKENLAGAKRPVAGKALPQSDIIYSTAYAASLGPLPMINLPDDSLGSGITSAEITRPSQKPVVGISDPGRTSIEYLTQADRAIFWNIQPTASRAHRVKIFDDYRQRPHEQPTTEPRRGQLFSEHENAEDKVAAAAKARQTTAPVHFNTSVPPLNAEIAGRPQEGIDGGDIDTALQTAPVETLDHGNFAVNHNQPSSATEAVAKRQTVSNSLVSIQPLLNDPEYKLNDIEEGADSGKNTSPSSFSFDTFDASPSTAGIEHTSQSGSVPRQTALEHYPMSHDEDTPLDEARQPEAVTFVESGSVKPHDGRISEDRALREHHDRRVSCFKCGAQLLRSQVPDHLRSAGQAGCRRAYALLARALAKQLRAIPQEISETSTPTDTSPGDSMERSVTPEWRRNRSLPPPGCVQERWVGMRAYSAPPADQSIPVDNDTPSTNTCSNEATCVDTSQHSNGTRRSEKRPLDATNEDASGDSGPLLKRRKRLLPENEKPWECIYHNVMTALRRLSHCETHHWPSPAGMYRHMRERHKIYICEKCFTTFASLDAWNGHKKRGEDPCHDSCNVSRCRRATRRSLPRPKPCPHLESSMERWEAARSVVHDLLSQRFAVETMQPEVSTTQDATLSTTLPLSSNGFGLDNFDLVDFMQSSNAAMDTIEGVDDIFAGFSAPEEPMATLHDLGPLVVQLRQELAATQDARAKAEDAHARAEASWNAERHSLSRACEELAETSALSSTTRTMLQSDAPEVLYRVNRHLKLRAARAAAPNVTAGDFPGSYGTTLDDCSGTQDIASWLAATSQPEIFQPLGIFPTARGHIDPKVLSQDNNQQRPIVHVPS